MKKLAAHWLTGTCRPVFLSPLVVKLSWGNNDQNGGRCVCFEVMDMKDIELWARSSFIV